MSMSLRPLHPALLGATNSAVGTTALNAVTYLDMALRGRPSSSTPEKTRIPVPGHGDAEQNRIAGLGPLTGLLAGVDTGAALGLARAAGWRPGLAAGTAAAALGALVGTNGPMTALGVTDPRDWLASSWVADLVPHLAYGAVTAAVLDRLTDR